MIIRPKVPRKDVDIEYLQVPAAAQEGSSLRAAEDNISKAKSKSDHKSKTAKTTKKAHKSRIYSTSSTGSSNS